MKKRKIYEISVIDKTYSKTISDETKFYTSDTALELVFKLKETEYTFESAEIVLLNIDDRSLVTRPVAKVNSDFVYELDDDIIPHYGEWHGQLRFEAGETYVSSPVKFRIENDLSNDRPPQLSDVQSWVSLKRYADSLVGELKQAVLSIEGVEDTFNENETARQNQFETAEQSRQDTFETNESERDETFKTNEDIRQTQELEREKAENQRQSEFDDNEASRTETFNSNETTRQENETVRQQAEQERQSAELTRVENEKQRNLTSVDEFIKLQNAVGGRNYLLNSGKAGALSFSANNNNVDRVEVGVENGLDWVTGVNVSSGYFSINQFSSTSYSGGVGKNYSEDLTKYSGVVTYSIDVMSPQPVRIRLGEHVGLGSPNITLEPNKWTRLSWTYDRRARPAAIQAAADSNKDIPVGTKIFWKNYKIEKGSVTTPHTKAPEDYTVVSKDDYYNHVKLMNELKDNQFNQLRKAVIALGGTI